MILCWTFDLHEFFSKEKLIKRSEDLPLISATQEDFKELPPEEELFPHSKSEVWNSFEEKEVNSYDFIDKKRTSEKIAMDTKKEDLKTDILKDENEKIKSNSNINTEAVIINEKIDAKNLPMKGESEMNKSQSLLSDKKEVKEFSSNEKQGEDEELALLVDEQNFSKKEDKTFIIQIASLKTENKAIEEWQRFKKKYKPNLDKMNFHIEQVNLENNKVFHRLFLDGFISKNVALSFCKEILKEKSCIIRLK